MDPRRARDPRLARPDPRLQRQGQPGPPQYSNAPQPPYPTYPQHATSNGSPSHSQTPPQMQPPYSTGPASNQQLQEEAEKASSLPPPATTSQPTPQPTSDAKGKSIYKPRPLFCVVCASNQVRRNAIHLWNCQAYQSSYVEPVDGRTLRTRVSPHYLSKQRFI